MTPPPMTGPRYNQFIQAPKVRVIDENGENLGVMITREAFEQAQEVGVDRSEIPPNFGEDGLMPLTFVLESDSWAIMVGNDQGMNEPGDIGTFTYDDHGRLVTTSHSEGCPGCVITLRWTAAQDELTIAMVEKTGDPLEELILSGQWERVP